MPRSKAPSFIDLFCGCGGLSLGFLQAGYKCRLAVDNEPKAVSCYNMNLKGKKDSGAVQYDLGSLKSQSDVIDFLAQNGLTPDDCDVLAGGPPCQSFSVVGRNKVRALMKSGGSLKSYWLEMHKKRNMLFETYALFLEVIKPKWFLFENVPTIMNHEMFPSIIQRFTDIKTDNRTDTHYELIYDKYLCSDYGIPQNRRRFILIGYRTDRGMGGWSGLVKRPQVSVSQALGDLPAVMHGNKERILKYKTKPKSDYQHRMRIDVKGNGTPFVSDHVCRSHNRDDLKLFDMMRQGGKFADPDVQKTIREINPNHKLIKYSAEKFKDKLHKLEQDKPAWTVTAHLQKDCYKFIHYNQPRTITVREAARLQSFPDWYNFEGISMVSSFGLIGNAVPPILAEVFARSFIYSENQW